MDVFIRYKEIKKRLVEGAVFSEEFSEVFDSVAIDCPALWYTGQYQTAKDNVSVVCPVVYIEMPKAIKIDHFPRKLQVVKDAQIKIHILGTAPYKGTDNAMQDAAIAKHQKMIDDVQLILNGWQMRDTNGSLMCSQFILVNENTMNYMSSFAFSILTYKCEFYHKES